MNVKKIVPAVVAGVMLIMPVAGMAASNEASTEGRIRFIADPEGGGIYDIHHPDNSDDLTTDEPLWIRPLPPKGDGLSPGEAGGYGQIEQGTAAPLRINFAPNFYFGTQRISDVNEDYHPYYLRAGVSQRRATQEDVVNGQATAVGEWIAHRTPTVTGDRIDENIPHFIQITDARGNMGGWSLTVSNTPFTAARPTSGDFQGPEFDALFPGGYHELRGASITFDFNNAAHNTYAKNPLDNIEVHTNDIVLEGTDAQRNVMVAPIGSGSGIHQAVWGTQEEATKGSTNETITLSVPGTSTQLAGIDYTTTLTWSLSDAPSNVAGN
jgi:hypothetical protein